MAEVEEERRYERASEIDVSKMQLWYLGLSVDEPSGVQSNDECNHCEQMMRLTPMNWKAWMTSGAEPEMPHPGGFLAQSSLRRIVSHTVSRRLRYQHWIPDCGVSCIKFLAL